MVKFWSRRVIALSILVLITVPLIGQCVGQSEEDTGHVLRDSIQIYGDDGFTASNGVVGGRGTASDPYVIKGWDIQTRLDIGIKVARTTAWFTIVDCEVGSGDQPTNQFSIFLDSVSNCKISHVSAGNCQVAMMLSEVADVAIEYCEFTYARNGVYVSGATGPVAINHNTFIGIHQSIDVDDAVAGIEVRGNKVVTDDDSQIEGSIHIYRSVGGIVSGNVLDRSWGLSIGYSTGLVVENNILVDCSIFIWGDSAYYYTSNKITTSNKVNGRPVLQLSDVRDKVVDCSFYGEVIGANLLRVSLRNFVKTGDVNQWLVGMWIGFSSQVTISSCSFSQMLNGLAIVNSSFVSLRDSRLSDGTIIFASNVNSLEIVGNSFYNGSGLQLFAVSNCYVYHNNIYGAYGDFLNVYDNSGSLHFDNGYPDGGNYWSEIPGRDSNSDGISDVPVIIPTNSIDWSYNDSYPLMSPFNRSSSNDSLILWVLTGIVGAVAVGFLVSFRKTPVRNRNL